MEPSLPELFYAEETSSVSPSDCHLPHRGRLLDFRLRTGTSSALRTSVCGRGPHPPFGLPSADGFSLSFISFNPQAVADVPRRYGAAAARPCRRLARQPVIIRAGARRVHGRKPLRHQARNHAGEHIAAAAGGHRLAARHVQGHILAPHDHRRRALEQHAAVVILRKLLGVFDKYEISIEHVPSGVDSVAVVVSTEAVEPVLYKILDEIEKELHPESLQVTDGIALIAAVGRSMAYRPGISGRLFAALGENGVNVRMISQGPDEINIVFGVKNEDFEKSIRILYNSFVRLDVNEE